MSNKDYSTFLISKDFPILSGYFIRTKGIDFRDYMRNPIVLSKIDILNSKCIGETLKIHIRDNELFADIHFFDKHFFGIPTFIQKIYKDKLTFDLPEICLEQYKVVSSIEYFKNKHKEYYNMYKELIDKTRLIAYTSKLLAISF